MKVLAKIAEVLFDIGTFLLIAIVFAMLGLFACLYIMVVACIIIPFMAIADTVVVGGTLIENYCEQLSIVIDTFKEVVLAFIPKEES